MDRTFSERLALWLERTESNLRSRWYLWPLAFILDLFRDRLFKATNDYLDTHVVPMGEFAKGMLAHIPGSITLAVILSLTIVIGLAIHAYFDTRMGNTSELNKRLTEKTSAADRRDIIINHLRKFFPRVQYKGVGSAIKSQPDGSTIHNLVIGNENGDLQNTAFNVTAELRYQLYNAKAITCEGVWVVQGESVAYSSVSIPGTQSARLAFLYQIGDRFYTPLLRGGSGPGNTLQLGRWRIAIVISAANSDTIEGVCEYLLGADGELRPETPWSFTRLSSTPLMPA